MKTTHPKTIPTHGDIDNFWWVKTQNTNTQNVTKKEKNDWTQAILKPWYSFFLSFFFFLLTFCTFVFWALTLQKTSMSPRVGIALGRVVSFGDNNSILFYTDFFSHAVTSFKNFRDLSWVKVKVTEKMHTGRPYGSLWSKFEESRYQSLPKTAKFKIFIKFHTTSITFPLIENSPLRMVCRNYFDLRYIHTKFCLHQATSLMGYANCQV